MLGYNYNKDTKEFTGTSELRINPRNGSTYLVPANCTQIEINGKKAGSVEVFESNSWKYEEDHRKETVYSKETGVSIIIDYLGKIKSDETKVKPPINTRYYKFSKNKWVIDESKKTELIDTITNLIKTHTEQAIKDELWKLPEEEETKFETEYEQFRYSTREDAIASILALADKTMAELIELLK